MASAINYADRQIIALLKPLIEQDLGWDDVTYGHLVTIFQFATACSLIAAGWFVDRVGIRREPGGDGLDRCRRVDGLCDP